MVTPVRLHADNFTPPQRTPWGGRKLRQRYKAHLGFREGPPVGESWEISVEPSFPSRIVGGGSLAAAIAAEPEPWLGTALAARHGQTPLLVKLLDAADNLSLQVHPADGDPKLAADESGKPEAWVVLEAEPGAGLFLGFREGVDRETVEACIRDEGGRVDELMNFVEVTGGEVFVIEAGTPHAIGAGLTLLEPQWVAPGKRGVTYRFWDWNRRYDAAGRPDPTGHARPLQLKRSLAVTDWQVPGGEAFVERCRAEPVVLAESPILHERLVDGPWFVLERLTGSGAHQVPSPGTLSGVVCVRGALEVITGAGELELVTGQSGVIPASAGPFRVRGNDTLAFLIKATDL